ncbi:efflux RND transporter periplasmic adaptor subunit [Caldimonas tepidiphila]|uniref:efflux RND transporter periplasmic adaptor subunit n=1 Tax=Caldimonas tepidiphila TaxID=2315841 RepID=UPI000E5B62BE|nr:efflux RND transporter periplasmic adaptor subunit [Caldimonas tepidiphila]
MNRKWIAALVALLLLALGAAAWWLGRDAEEAAAYRTAPLERGRLLASVSASGTVTPVAQVQVGSQVSGQMREVLVDFNSEVKRGQLLARLDPETFEYRVRQAEADVDAARASVLTAQANVQAAQASLSRARVELAEAGRDLERKQGLVALDFVSPAEAERARAAVATLGEGVKVAQAQLAVAGAQERNAEAVVRQREAQLAQARVDLQRTQIRAPVDGIVIKRSIEPGQTVAASLQAPELFVIARNLSDMQVEALVDEADIGRVSLGQTAGFTVDAFPSRQFEGTVRQMRKAAGSSQNVVTYTVVVGFDNPGTALLPGMTANVRILTARREDVLKLPNAALRVRLPQAEPVGSAASARSAAADDGPAKGGKPAAAGAARGRVYLPGSDGRPQVVEVRLGLSDGSMTELIVAPGSPEAALLQPGTAVITGVPAGGAARNRAPSGPRLPL